MANPYLEMELRTAPPEVLIGRLLDRAVQLASRAEASMHSEPVESTRAIARAVDIVSELRGTLDMEIGGEIAQNLDALYEYTNERLVLGGAIGETSAIGEALQILESLAATWRQLLQNERSA